MKGKMNIIPFGDNILVKRKKIGEKVGAIYLPQETKDRDTDLAIVVYIPDLTFTDKLIMEKANEIVQSVAKRAIETGDKDAIDSLMSFNDFIKRKSIKVGDEIFLNKYIGTDFYETETNIKQDLTLVNVKDILGVVQKEK